MPCLVSCQSRHHRSVWLLHCRLAVFAPACLVPLVHRTNNIVRHLSGNYVAPTLVALHDMATLRDPVQVGVLRALSELTLIEMVVRRWMQMRTGPSARSSACAVSPRSSTSAAASRQRPLKSEALPSVHRDLGSTSIA